MNMEAFYEENYNIVLGYLCSLCGDAHLAEDLTSETFLRAILKIDSFDGKVKAATWLCTIGRNLYLNEIRKRSRHVPLEGIPLAQTHNPEEAYLEQERTQSIWQLVKGLEPPKDQVVLMRQQGMSFREIADALGKSENWARVTFFRAKEKLIQGLEGLE